jgi:L-amino acid N-acyltransferase YncA
MIRRACHADAADLARIYNQSMVPGVFATSQLTAVDEADRKRWVDAHVDPYPGFVFDSASRGVQGWSSLSPFSIRPNLSTIAEVSLYVDERFRHQLVGAHLMFHLIAAARALGFRSLVSLTFRKNSASLRGLEAVGFRPVALVPEVCLLRGAWEDDIWLQKDLSVAEQHPRALRAAALLASRGRTGATA